MLLHLTGSYDSDRVAVSNPFQIEHIPSALSVYGLVIWKAHEKKIHILPILNNGISLEASTRTRVVQPMWANGHPQFFPDLRES
jgi:hypothetical protein